MDHFWGSKRVLVTGGSGFLGTAVVQRLRGLGCSNLLLPRSADCDLREQSDVRRLYRETRPDLVIHLAGRIGGIGDSAAHPAEFFYDNLVMGANLIEAGRHAGLEKFVQVGTVCSYPKFAPVPFREETLWDGYPEETNAPYGVAKKALLVQLQAYREQYGFNGIYLLPANLYGPGDNFDPDTSHVIPSLIRKLLRARDAGEREIVAWGSGSATREFLFVDDCAEAVLLAAERYDGGEPVNLGTGSTISIADLITLVARLVGYDGEIVYDRSRPDGQPRRQLDVTRAQQFFGFNAATPLEDGLRATLEWYLAHQDTVLASPATV